MKTKQLTRLGVPHGAINQAKDAIVTAQRAGMTPLVLHNHLRELLANPELQTKDPVFGAMARAVVEARQARSTFAERGPPAPYQRWGDDIEPTALEQMENACKLPVAVAGALMPDAHPGYGLPIGGVLATRNAVIPYAVGVDIACRMKLTVLDLPAAALKTDSDRLRRAIERETRFGVGSTFQQRRQHEVMDAEEWRGLDLAKKLQDKAWSQLGTSGSGNHFVEFGTLTLEKPDLGLEAGIYLALLSHSGSRGTGAEIAGYFSRLAMKLHPELPAELKHLAWLELDRAEGQEYWHAMELMGRYAAANHALIHRHIAQHLGGEVLAGIENHHNFAWKERHGGEEVIVHRKGATPAGENVLGIIPGSMGAPGYVVRGRGSPESLSSAAHGAGRRMSRGEANRRFNWHDVREFLAARNVELLSAGLDESPMAYKDIDEVMRAQRELVEPVARFDPRLVKMAAAGERPED